MTRTTSKRRGRARLLLGTAMAFGAGGSCGKSAPTPTFTGVFTDVTGVIATQPAFAVVPAAPDMHRPEPEATVGAMADLDGDGFPEVIVGPTALVDGVGPRPVELYRYDRAAGVLVDAGPAFMGTFSAAIDVDGDDKVDLLSPVLSSAVAYGHGDATFDTPTTLEGIDTGVPPGGNAFALTDLDRDGWLDFLLGGAGPSTQTIQPYLRTGPRSWAPHPTAFTANATPGATGILDVDFAAGRLVVVVGQGDSRGGAPSFFRAAGTDAMGYPEFEAFDPLPASRYFARGGGQGVTALSARAPMGVSVADLDGDGLLDLDVSLDPVHEILAGTVSWPFVEKTAQTNFALVAGDQGMPMLPWGVALVDLDRDGRVDVATAHGNDSSGFLDNSIGAQWFTVHWNAGDGTFVDVSSRLGVDRRGQYRALNVGDLDNDGDADAVVGGMGEMPRVLRNDVVGGHGLTLRLRGTTSNHLGIGSRVTVRATPDATEQVFFAGSIGSPLTAPEPLVFAGLGDATSAASVEILWPSGMLQRLTDVPADGLVRVVEPPTIALEPAARHAPADGVSAVTVSVSPRDPGGALRTDARVELRTEYGDARVDGPPEVTPDGMRFRIVAPAAPGSTLVRVTIDGTPAGVSPRIFWD